MATGDQSFSVRVRRPGNGVLIIRASGALDAAAEPRFAEPVRHRLACTASRLVLDLSTVTFLDTAGGVCLLEAATRSAMRDMTLVLVASPAVHRLLALMEVTDRFVYADDADQAATLTVMTQPHTDSNRRAGFPGDHALVPRVAGPTAG